MKKCREANLQELLHKKEPLNPITGRATWKRAMGLNLRKAKEPNYRNSYMDISQGVKLPQKIPIKTSQEPK